MAIRIPANKLAEFIIAKSPERKKTIVTQTKYGRGHPNYYQLFHGPARRFLAVGMHDATEIVAKIEHLKTRGATKWQSTDSTITTDAFKALIKSAKKLSALNVTFSELRANATTLLHLEHADVSVRPNLLVRGERKGKPLIGALRFYLAKETTYHLGVRGAELVAVMQYLWLRQVADGARIPDPELCMVLECLQERITPAPADPERHIAVIEHGCREFSSLWKVVDRAA